MSLTINSFVREIDPKKITSKRVYKSIIGKITGFSKDFEMAYVRNLKTQVTRRVRVENLHRSLSVKDYFENYI